MGDGLLIIAPGAAAGDARLQALLDAARQAGIEAERLRPATENALRERLASRADSLIVFVGSGRSRAAGHRTVDLEGSAGAAPRAVNLRHLAGLLAESAALRGVVLLAPGNGAAPLAGFARALVDGGVAAAMVWEAAAPALLALSVQAWLQRWRAGADWPSLAQADSTLPRVLEWAGGSAGAAMPSAPRPAVAPTPRPAPAAEPAPALPTAPGPTVEQLLADKRAGGRFDVFLCHNGSDKPAVRAIARQLRARGILPWLDEWELPPGQPWQPLLERQIEHIRAAAVFVGAAGVGPWQEQELYALLREFVARRAPVIPVLLPDAPSAPELPMFLRAMTYVDFRQREPEPLARLRWGITGERPGYG